MKKILFVSGVTPYDSVSHAGGKTINSYVKALSHNFEVAVVSLAYESEIDKMDLEEYGIVSMVGIIKNDIFHKILRRFYDWSYFYNKRDHFANLSPLSQRNALLKMLKILKKKGYSPDIIQLEYTHIIFLAEQIKTIYPNAMIVASEHDVTFLRLEREMIYTTEKKKKKVVQNRYSICKKVELDILRRCNLIVTHNIKDAKLLVENGLSKKYIYSIVPHYMHLEPISYCQTSNKVFFFGAMGRRENYLSAIWFIENVLPQLDNITFYVVGGNPPNQLKQYESDKVIITGFVDQVDKYFKDSLCMVAPLVLGAGIKVKILEAMSAGVVTLTNDIGIEGIPAKDGIEYIFCKEPSDYVDAIKQLQTGKILGKDISDGARSFTQKEFNLEDSIKRYAETLLKLNLYEICSLYCGL